MNIELLIEEITSRDTHKVWRSSCEIISLGQDSERIRPLIKYLPEIKEKTKGLEMGGSFAPNQRFIDFAIRTIEFHRDSTACSCNLYEEHGVDPSKEVLKGNIKIHNTILIDEKWPDYYNAECQKCSQTFKILEREGHYVWWKWIKT